MQRVPPIVLTALMAISSWSIATARTAGMSPTRYTRVIVLWSAPSAASQVGPRVSSSARTVDFQRLSLYRRELGIYQRHEIAYLAGRGIQLIHLRSFRAVLDGAAVEVRRDDVQSLRSAPGVTAVLSDPAVSPLLDKSTQLIGAPSAWQQIGGVSVAGRGEFIADIDTGIDISNPCFRDAGFKPPQYGRRADTLANKQLTNNKVVVARAFGDIANRSYSAEDISGHGTFTASIEACDADTPTPIGTHVSGVAPAAYLMNYNVFPRGSRGPYEDQVIAALDAALIDGADVANVSLGNPHGTGDAALDPEVQAVESASRAGLTVVAAAGNAGPSGQSLSSPASAPSAVAVGSVSNSRGLYSSVSVESATPDRPGIRGKEGSRSWDGIVGPRHMVYVGFGRAPGDDPRSPRANDFDHKSIKGKIVLVLRGSESPAVPLSVARKVQNAGRLGAVGIIAIDNVDEPTLPTLDQGGSSVPLLLVDRGSGLTLLAEFKRAPNLLVTLHSALSAFPETPDLLSTFSSRGYGAHFTIGPSLVAPGEDIYAATQRSFRSGDLYDSSGFTSQSGTSFAAPHVAGAVALLLQVRPRSTPQELRAILMESADPAAVRQPLSRLPATVLTVGGGMLDIGQALQTPGYITPSSIGFGEVDAADGPRTVTFHAQLHDAGIGAGTWALHVEPSGSSSPVVPSVPEAVPLTVNGTSDMTIRVSVPRSAPAGDYAGYIVAQLNGHALRIPYAVHVATQSVRRGTVLLIDNSHSNFRSQSIGSPYTSAWYYAKALQSLKWKYTYWNESKEGPASAREMRRARAVMYFTGAYVNGYSSRNGNPEALLAPLGPVDDVELGDYLDSGGRLFISGKGVTLSDENWLSFVLGARVSPSDATARPVARARSSRALPVAIDGAGAFASLHPIDFGSRGDGAKVNADVQSPTVGRVGVNDVVPVGVDAAGEAAAGGTPSLRDQAGNVPLSLGVTRSDEPSFDTSVLYHGRSLFMSFGFEGINDLRGYATRVQVMQRVLAWLTDVPSVALAQSVVSGSKRVLLVAHTSGAAPKVFTWRLTSTVYLQTRVPRLVYTFSSAGTYRVRVMFIDALGHAAVSAVQVVRAG